MAVEKCGNVDEQVLHNFAKRLANNEPKLRKNALKKLKGWMETRSNAFSGDEFLKVWKGLHYCMWMTDKPLIQEELSDRMSELVHCFKSFDTAASFISAFFATEAREWSGTDRLRMDKFMMLIRRMLRQSFVLLQRRGWLLSDTSRLAEVLHVTVLDGLNDHIPDGIRFHMDDIFIEELNRAAAGGQTPPSAQQVVQLLVPFCHLVAKSSNKVLVNHTVKTVFDTLLVHVHGDGMSSDEDTVNNIQVDYQQLIDRLTRLAVKRGCKNRACIYRLLSRLRESTEGKQPVDVHPMAVDSQGGVDMNPVVRLAVQSEVQSSAAIDSAKQRKRKRKAVQVNGCMDNVGGMMETNDCSLGNCEGNVRRQKRKRLTVSDQVDGVMADRQGVVTDSVDRHGAVIAGECAGDSKSSLDEEVEIFIPNKKYKGPLRDVYAKLAAEGSRKIKRNSAKEDDSSPFMTFVPVDKTPMALVRRRNKLSHSEPKELHKSSKELTAALPRSAGRPKKVKFAMNLNKSQDFEDSLNVTPRQPYNPSLQPDRTILKPSPDTSWLKLPTTAKRKSLRTRPRAADFF